MKPEAIRKRVFIANDTPEGFPTDATLLDKFYMVFKKILLFKINFHFL